MLPGDVAPPRPATLKPALPPAKIGAAAATVQNLFGTGGKPPAGPQGPVAPKANVPSIHAAPIQAAGKAVVGATNQAAGNQYRASMTPAQQHTYDALQNYAAMPLAQRQALLAGPASDAIKSFHQGRMNYMQQHPEADVQGRLSRALGTSAAQIAQAKLIPLPPQHSGIHNLLEGALQAGEDTVNQAWNAVKAVGKTALSPLKQFAHPGESVLANQMNQPAAPYVNVAKAGGRLVSGIAGGIAGQVGQEFAHPGESMLKEQTAQDPASKLAGTAAKVIGALGEHYASKPWDLPTDAAAAGIGIAHGVAGAVLSVPLVAGEMIKNGVENGHINSETGARMLHGMGQYWQHSYGDIWNNAPGADAALHARINDPMLRQAYLTDLGSMIVPTSKLGGMAARGVGKAAEAMGVKAPGISRLMVTPPAPVRRGAVTVTQAAPRTGLFGRVGQDVLQRIREGSQTAADRMFKAGGPGALARHAVQPGEVLPVTQSTGLAGLTSKLGIGATRRAASDVLSMSRGMGDWYVKDAIAQAAKKGEEVPLKQQIAMRTSTTNRAVQNILDRHAVPNLFDEAGNQIESRGASYDTVKQAVDDAKLTSKDVSIVNRAKTVDPDKKNGKDWVAIPKATMDEINSFRTPTSGIGKAMSFQSRMGGLALLGTNPGWIMHDLARQGAFAFFMKPQMLQTWTRDKAFMEALTPIDQANLRVLAAHGAVHDIMDAGAGAHMAGMDRLSAIANTGMGERLREFWNNGDPVHLFGLHERTMGTVRLHMFTHEFLNSLRESGQDISNLHDAATKAAQYFEAYSRSTRLPSDLYAEALPHITRAAQTTAKILGDFRNYNALERTVLKRSLAFYGYLRYSTRLAFYTLPVEHPAMAALLSSLGGLQDRDRRDFLASKGGDSLPFMQGNVFFGKGGSWVWNPNRDNPLMNSLTQYDPTKPPDQLLSSVSPLMLSLIETATGRDYYRNRDLTYVNQLGKAVPLHGNVQQAFGGHGTLGDYANTELSRLINLVSPVRDVLNVVQPSIRVHGGVAQVRASTSLPWNPQYATAGQQATPSIIQAVKLRDAVSPWLRLAPAALPFPQPSADIIQSARETRQRNLQNKIRDVKALQRAVSGGGSSRGGGGLGGGGALGGGGGGL